MLDMVKCYEKITHQVIAAAAKRVDFPLRILRVCLGVYARKRIISVDGAVTEEFRIGTSIVPGCAFATTMLREVLIECLDMGRRLYLDVLFFVYVDVVKISTAGTADQVVERIAGATRFTVLALERSEGYGLQREVKSDRLVIRCPAES